MSAFIELPEGVHIAIRHIVSVRTQSDGRTQIITPSHTYYTDMSRKDVLKVCWVEECAYIQDTQRRLT